MKEKFSDSIRGFSALVRELMSRVLFLIMGGVVIYLGYLTVQSYRVDGEEAKLLFGLGLAGAGLFFAFGAVARDKEKPSRR